MKTENYSRRINFALYESASCSHAVCTSVHVTHFSSAEFRGTATWNYLKNSRTNTDTTEGALTSFLKNHSNYNKNIVRLARSGRLNIKTHTLHFWNVNQMLV